MMIKNSTEASEILRKHFLNSFYGMTVTPKNSCFKISSYLKYKRHVGFIEQRKFIYADTDSIYIELHEVTK